MLRIAIVTLHLAVAPLVAQTVEAARVHAALVGHWSGTLEYKDYRDPTKRVTLPTIIDVTPRSAGGTSLHVVYDDGPGKTVVSDDRFVIADDMRSFDWTGVKDTVPEVFRMISVTQDGGTIRMVGERDGSDNDAPATLRETFTITVRELVVVKEVRPAGGTFSFRHTYRMTR
ncbi:MAG: hypothetical protein ABIX19_17310 [Gemmatimonadaceae bacterium]